MSFIGILSVVTTPLVEITKCLITPLKREIGYLVHCKRTVDDLGNQVEELRTKRNDVCRLVDVARRNNEEIREEVEKWVTSVAKIESEMGTLDDKVNHNKMCLMNCRSRYGLGKEATKMIKDVKKLLSQENFNTVSHPAPPPSLESRPTGDFEAFESTRLNIKEVVDALRKGDVNRVGIYGMGGVGKTTIVKQVGIQVTREKLCDTVVMVTVSQNPNIKMIQVEMADNLGMKFKAETESVRAGELMNRLMMEETVLIILDDIWNPLELEQVGIPSGDEHNGCKILITTRRKDVCNLMRCNVNMKVKVLSDEDSWSLFRKKTGGAAVDSPSLQDVAKDIVRECGGLPLAIVTLAGVLRNKDRLVWDDVLEQLKNSSPSEIPGMEEKVYASLMLSYNYIESDESKFLFLFCCLFGEDEDIHMRDLLIYGIGEGFFLKVNTLFKAKKRLYTMVNNLIASSLLLRGDEDGPYVRMHDLARDVAIFIASNINYHGFLVKPRANLKEWPEMENLKQYKRISLMGNEIVKLSGTPMCPQIRTLFLQGNSELEQIEDSFFQGMESLVVLDLSGASISSLPTSISLLKNLRTLNLSYCSRLKDLSLQGQEKLEVLILKGTGIHELPNEIGKMFNLKLLDLSDTNDLETIPRNTISQLGHLEELLMQNSFSNWEVEQTGGERSAEVASFAEFASMPALRTLTIDVKNVECLYQEISCQWKNLDEFRIYVDDDRFHLDRDEFDRIMVLKNILRPVSDWVKELLERTECLRLESYNKSTGLFQSELLLQRLHDLTELRVESCEELDEIFHYEETIEGHPLLSRLRVLRLENLERLTSIWNGVVPFETLHNLETLDVIDCGRLRNLFSFALAQSIQRLHFLLIWECHNMENIIWMEDIELTQLQSTTIFRNLREIVIRECDSLKSVFSSSLARGLQNLEKLVIQYCMGIEEIISADDERMGLVNEKVELPQLKMIELWSLPKLKSFFYQETVLELPSLVEITICYCPNLKRFPLEPQSTPNLKTIKTEKEWFEGLEWEDQSFKMRLQPLRTDPPQVTEFPTIGKSLIRREDRLSRF